MTEETPEVPEEKPSEEQAAKKAAKKKTARKRTSKPKAEEKVDSVDAGQSGSKATEAEESAGDSGKVEAKASEPASEVRRISNKPGEEPVETVRARKSTKGKRNSDKDSDTDDVPEGQSVISEPPSSEDGGGKRRRRRRRKGGQGDESDEASRGPRPKLDPELVAKKAWKVFLAEVSEEGLALISDQDARELSKRSFRLAEVFLEEAARHQ